MIAWQCSMFVKMLCVASRLALVRHCGCLMRGNFTVLGLEEGSRAIGSEPDKGIIELWRLG